MWDGPLDFPSTDSNAFTQSSFWESKYMILKFS